MKKLIALAIVAASSTAFAAGEAKNVIFFLGDGMGPTVITASRIYKGGATARLTMEGFERTARIKTHSNNAQTTDSAPSMSAYMTGVKMNNNVIAMSSDTVADKTMCNASNGKPVTTILELAKASGKAVGAVTTTEIMDATPAATFGHICARSLFLELAAQLVPGGAGFNPALGDGVNVLFGGQLVSFLPLDPATNPSGRPDGRNLIDELKAKGYRYASDHATFDALAATSGHAIGLFSNGLLDYEIDRVPAKQPSLAEMTAKAIDILQNAGGTQGYFLMVEGGRIDHALHATNAKRAVTETLAFDDAIKTALAKVDLTNTLLVVTADHDHTMTFNGYPKRDNNILDVLYSYTDGQLAKDAKGLFYTVLSFGNGPRRDGTRGMLTTAQVTADSYNQETTVRLSTETHGGGDVMLMATGAGSAIFKGTIENAKVFQLLKTAFGF